MKPKNLAKNLWRNRLTPWRPIVVGVARRTSPITRKVHVAGDISMKVVLPELIGERLYLGLPYEEDTTAFMEDSLKPGMTFFDVGAHIGYTSLLARDRVGELGKVVSFEPIPETFELLAENCELYNNITLERLAINEGHRANVSLRYFGPSFSAQSTAFTPRSSKNKYSSQSVDVLAPATSIDRYIKESGISPDFIKIDSEGSEMEALSGATLTLINRKPVVSIEVGDTGRTWSNSSRSCLDFLRIAGYDLFEYSESGIRPHTVKDAYQGNFNILGKPRG
ncbi:FkbM family methyltransferase [Candidatus Pacearchaeota archaeon]|nr:FkbM family methyltransferase [Candidatus Pacearchaeota archaeon]